MCMPCGLWKFCVFPLSFVKDTRRQIRAHKHVWRQMRESVSAGEHPSAHLLTADNADPGWNCVPSQPVPHSQMFLSLTLQNEPVLRQAPDNKSETICIERNIGQSIDYLNRHKWYGSRLNINVTFQTNLAWKVWQSQLTSRLTKLAGVTRKAGLLGMSVG